MVIESVFFTFYLQRTKYKFNTFGEKSTTISFLNREFFSNITLCSKPNIHNPCPGDSGGPLICNGYLYGLTNFIYNVHNSEDVRCGSSHLQSGYLFIYFYKDWISNTVLNTGNLIKLYDKLFNISIILTVYNCS